MTKRVALVTGANKGIGREIAYQLSRRGLVVFVGSRDEGRGEEAAAKMRADGGGDARAIQLDVTNAASMAAAAARIRDEVGRLDVLVNNAGIGTATSPDFATIYATNVFGTWALTRVLLPLLEASKGQIINVSSSLASLTKLSAPGSETVQYALLAPAYTSSKAALNAVTLILAAELRPKGIRVNSVCPGFVATDLNGHRGPRTVEQGARITVELATTDRSDTGGFFDEAGAVAW
jgi:NAD(P)-dependent dehydrogenase (short-subunit alcohol dehydrogenase family)